MSSTSDKMSGKTKQVVGKITNNKVMQLKGKIKETKGKVESNLKSI